jgi:TonB family protein
MRNIIQLLALSWLLTVDSFEPARFESGDVFLTQPLMTAGGGEVLLELDVSSSGEVTGVIVLRKTPPFTELLRQAVSGWRFAPAREVLEPPEAPVAIDSKVLVVGFFQPAMLEVPEDVAPPSADVPFPATMVGPLFPSTAYLHTSLAVAIEVEVGAEGKVTSSKVVRSAEGLDSAATNAAREWRFRPARRKGKAVSSVAYIVFGFREPVVSGEGAGPTGATHSSRSATSDPPP